MPEFKNDKIKYKDEQKPKCSYLGHDAWCRYNRLSEQQKYLWNNPPNENDPSYKAYDKIANFITD